MEEIKIERDLPLFLRDLIKSLLKVDVKLSRTRKREVVNARMIYSYILRNCGWGYSAIGRSVVKDHATIMHYVRCFENYMKSDSELRNSYNLILSEFNSRDQSVVFLTEDELKKKLSLKIIDLNKELKSRVEKDDRLENIYKIITQRTIKGQEDKIESLINRMYNGVYS
jgi:hypothetical protein